MRTVFVICFGLLAAFAALTPAQGTSELHELIASSVADKNYEAAITALRQAQQTDPKIFEKNNYDYLLARLLERRGDFAAAMATYQSVASRNSILKPYALWHISRIAQSSGNLMLERMYLRELIAAAPDSRLRPAAENRLVRSFFESGDHESVVGSLKSSALSAASMKPAAEVSISRENQVLLGQSLLQLGRTEEARAVFSKLLDRMPNSAQPDDFALAAAEGLDQLDRTSSPAKLSDLEHLRRASIYQFNRSFEKAREHYRAIIDDHPASGITPDATYQIGRGFAQQGEVGEAVNWFERTLEQFPEHQVAKDALLQAASSYARLAKYKEAIARYKRFIEKYADDERIDRAYLNIIDVLRDQGEQNEALAWSAETQEVFRGKLPEALALFSSARLFIAQTDWASALAALEKLSTMPDLGGTRVPGGTSVAEISFLRAFTLEQLGRYPGAVEAYLSIPDGRGEYYGWRATERLRLLATDAKAKGAIDQKTLALVGAIRSKDPETSRKNLQAIIRLASSEDARQEYLATLRNIYRSLPAYSRIPTLRETQLGRTKPLDAEASADSVGNELYFLGLCDEAAPELEAAAKQQNSPVSYTLAKCYLEGDIANKAVAFIEPLWRNVPADYQVELIPHDQLEMLYPAPYRGSLLKYAPARNVDPRFVLSIMRQESRYRADIKSYAAARGLMQFISSTANTIAAKLNTKDFTQDDLYDPSTAILFGSQYLADLFAAFPDQPAAVAASYNGGDDNMRRWLLRSRSNSPDRYVPEIVFSQSKDYVYKVMANYRVYRFLYDEYLKRKD